MGSMLTSQKSFACAHGRLVEGVHLRTRCSYCVLSMLAACSYLTHSSDAALSFICLGINKRPCMQRSASLLTLSVYYYLEHQTVLHVVELAVVAATAPLRSAAFVRHLYNRNRENFDKHTANFTRWIRLSCLLPETYNASTLHASLPRHSLFDSWCCWLLPGACPHVSNSKIVILLFPMFNLTSSLLGS